MRRFITITAGLVVGILAAVVGFATVAQTEPAPQPYGAPIGPRMAEDTGAGERLVLVVGGVYASRADAEAANEQMPFGDVQGYYVVPAGQFQGFRHGTGVPGEFALVSAFRTDEGAAEFVAMARAFGAPATIYPERVVSLGGIYAGLGQERAPDGSGPLVGPVEASLP